jgi:hypothetical protein
METGIVAGDGPDVLLLLSTCRSSPYLPLIPQISHGTASIRMDICLNLLGLGRTTVDRFVTQRPLSVITRGYHADGVAPDLDLT